MVDPFLGLRWLPPRVLRLLPDWLVNRLVAWRNPHVCDYTFTTIYDRSGAQVFHEARCADCGRSI